MKFRSEVDGMPNGKCGMTRREFVRLGCAAAVVARVGVRGRGQAAEGVVLNDMHSQLNPTRVHRVVQVEKLDDIQTAIRAAKSEGRAISIAGGRHAMGAQQFGSDAIHLDTARFGRVLGFDVERGIVDVQAGIKWPELLAFLADAQKGVEPAWGIVQKQTGADRLSLGGAVAANVHGRGLRMKPIVDQIESLTLLDADGEIRRCSRTENPDLFRLVVGGYGLFGVVASVQLRLWRRRKVQRIVEIRDLVDIPAAFAGRIRDGYLYGDFQFATDSKRSSFLARGVFSCYRPVDPETPLTANPTRFHPEDWARLTYYTHKYKRRAFEVYTKRYLATSGQIYYSDSQLSAAYVDDYHKELDRKLHARVKGTEMITEIYVPRAALPSFMEAAREELRRTKANLIYGTVRLIEREDETFLRWAREPWACIIFNLHVDHTEKGVDGAKAAFRALIDLGIRFGGTYYLTYHNWATREQVEQCYPQFREFLARKRTYDPEERFQSDWYRRYRTLFA